MAVLHIFPGQPPKDRKKPIKNILIVSRTGLETIAIPGKRNSKLLKSLGRKYLLEVSEGAFENSTLHFYISLSNTFLVYSVPCRNITGSLYRLELKSVDSLSLGKWNFSVKGKAKLMLLSRHISSEVFKGI